MKKYRETAGADEETPSRAQYFSWVNSTNEGSMLHVLLEPLPALLRQ